MPFESRTTVPGSERSPVPHAEQVGSIDPNEPVRVTVFIRRKGSEPRFATNGSADQLTHEQLKDRHGADPTDIALVERFAHEYHLTVVDQSVQKRRVILTGSAADVSRAFGATLECYRIASTGHEFRGRTGAISIPTELEPAVIAVLG